MQQMFTHGRDYPQSHTGWSTPNRNVINDRRVWQILFLIAAIALAAIIEGRGLDISPPENGEAEVRLMTRIG